MRPATLAILLLATSAFVGGSSAATPDMAKEVRPILAKRCLNCHGPDAKKRKGDLRLDTKEGLMDPEVVTPGRASESGLIQHILSKDPEETMPPPGKGDPVTPEELKVLQAWIDGGAAYAEHWSFTAPSKPAPPSDPKTKAAQKNEIDAFTFSTLTAKGMEPA